MDTKELIDKVQDVAKVDRIFGQPTTEHGVTVIPVVRIGGGGGGGSGKQEGERPGTGSGGGFGLNAAPAGVFVIKDGDVRWRPVVDVNKVILGGQIVAVVALLTIRAIARMRFAAKSGRSKSHKRH